MIRSKYFWAGAILLAVIPLLVIDIPKHYIDWQRDVHDEMILVAQNSYAYTTQQKAEILDGILAANKSLMALMYIKGFVSFLLFCFSIYFFRRYFINQNKSPWKAVLSGALLLILTTAAKLYSWTGFDGNEKIRLLTETTADSTLTNIYNANFKGKVVYVDFWGTTCLPCLEEFKNFTRSLKEKYKDRSDIAYLYICGGRRLLWKQQLQKFDIEGYHIFLGAEGYADLYRRAVSGSKDIIITMPRYLIIDKTGKIAETDAPRPSDKGSIYSKLDKYLAVK
jgi:thiol-disulfide isomerase/thioredoxin